MEKNTLIAVVLSVIVIVTVSIINTNLNSSKSNGSIREETESPVSPLPMESVENDSVETKDVSSPVSEIVAVEEDLPHQTINAETENFKITFSNKGGIITSLKLKKHEDGEDLLEVILGGTGKEGAFDLLLGDATALPITDNFSYRRIDGETFEFSRNFLAADGIPFSLKKTYVFKPRDYVMELKISIANTTNAAPAINNRGYAYTLRFGPQIGPNFKKLDGRSSYRYYYVMSENKARKVKVKNGYIPVEGRATWVAVAGKYFTVIGIPDATPYTMGFSNKPVPGLIEGSQIYFSRPVIKNTKSTEDIFRFYLGPKSNQALRMYDRPEDNGFNLGNLHLDQVIESATILGWLEFLLSKLLIFFYAIVGNYGVAIILVTVVIKILFFPFTRKGSESTAKMSALSPQLEELKKKYKDKPEQLNRAMADLYKKEGVSPLGGCLPLIIQMPFFFAMYGLFNKYFEFRGATFIPGWITDLSAPEAIFTFQNFTMPFLGWDAIRLLPILFVLTQLGYTKMMQPASGQANNQMKMMNILMPVMFFFILYNAPSGLLIYWIASNIITALQQIITNKVKRKGTSS